LKRGDLGIDG
jgi:hypothetical protein